MVMRAPSRIEKNVAGCAGDVFNFYSVERADYFFLLAWKSAWSSFISAFLSPWSSL